MKFIRFNFKQVFTGAFAIAAFAVANPSFAQLPATTDDIRADGSHGFGRTILNTGTDAISISVQQAEELKLPAGNLQVMVWDGEQPRLSWASNNGPGSLVLNKCFRDPDVVVHIFDKQLYAMVVYEDHDGQIIAEVFHWEDNAFVKTYPDTYQTLGNNPPLDANGARRLKGANPNIDVNSEGKVAVTWHESFSYPATSTVTYGSFQETYSFEVVRSEIYAVFGIINGYNLQNSSFGLKGISSGTNTKGDKISVTGNLLYEHNMYPDVALSDSVNADGDLAVTFTYSKMYFKPFTYNTEKNWVIDQRIIPVSGTGSLGTHYFNGNAYTGSDSYRPRVASRKWSYAATRKIDRNYAYDFEAVTGPVHRGCDEDGYYTYSPIYNFGCYNNAIRPAIIVNSGYTDTENYEPVVSYRYDTLGTKYAEYIVSWTMNTNYGPAHQRNLNVMAATMFNGVRQGSQLAWVNKGNLALDPLNQPFMEAQHIPSIAGIYSDSENRYLFVDLETASGANEDVKYKGSQNKPGTVQLRQSNGGNTSGFTAYPNPFTGEVRFNVQVEATDAAQILTIIDITGRQIDKLDVQNLKPGVHSLSWQSRSALPAGVYLARLQTRDKVTTIRIVKQ